jgi:hypothetical protein
VNPQTGTTEVEAWSNITMAPDFPTVAQVITELYPQSGGRQIDGVFSIDVFGISGLLEMTGPIDVPGITLEDLDADGIVPFLLEKTGGDSLAEIQANLAALRARSRR